MSVEQYVELVVVDALVLWPLVECQSFPLNLLLCARCEFFENSCVRFNASRKGRTHIQMDRAFRHHRHVCSAFQLYTSLHNNVHFLYEDT